MKFIIIIVVFITTTTIIIIMITLHASNCLIISLAAALVSCHLDN